MSSRAPNPHDEETEFALSGRLSFADVQAQRCVLLENESLIATLEALPQGAMLFNRSRQMIHANGAALALMAETKLEKLLGLRLGEIVGCENTVGLTGGCGGEDACGSCGSVNALLPALGGKTVEHQLIVNVDREGHSTEAIYAVRAAPVPLGFGPGVVVLIERT